MFRRPQYIALIFVVLLVLVVVSLPAQTATQLKLTLGGCFLPLLGLASSTRTLTEHAANALVPRRALLDRITELSRENERLRFQAMQSNLIWLENNKLRQAVAWHQQIPWRLKWNNELFPTNAATSPPKTNVQNELCLARVILRDPANWWRTLQIDRGRRDGVITNLPILTSDGLVGRVSQVGFSTSQVVLIGDPNCRVSAIVENTQDHGIIQAGASSIFDPSIVELAYLDGQSAARPGLLVVTSGLGGMFPKGIPVGKVIETNSVGFGLSTEARVKLAADLRHLDHVFVLFP